MRLFSSNFNLLFTRKTPDLHIVKDDPDDDKFIGCALALKADVIITGDKALLDVKEYHGINIVKPADFLKIYIK
jgi:predicted nucleic acid-binding protein